MGIHYRGFNDPEWDDEYKKRAPKTIKYRDQPQGTPYRKRDREADPDGIPDSVLPWNDLFWNGEWFRWSWAIFLTVKQDMEQRETARVAKLKKQGVKDAKAKSKKQVMVCRNATTLLCFLLNLTRKKDHGARKRNVAWDGWMQCTRNYIFRGTGLTVEEQKTAFITITTWAESKMRGAPARRWVKLDLDKLVQDLDTFRKKRYYGEES